ncbi:unnamed protein product, partial [Brassica oleracea var. botrytis]
MSLPCFRILCDTLQTNYGLQPTLNVSIEESVAIFIQICGHNEVQRNVGLRFGRNQETLQRNFLEVLTATEKWRVIVLGHHQEKSYTEFLKG